MGPGAIPALFFIREIQNMTAAVRIFLVVLIAAIVITVFGAAALYRSGRGYQRRKAKPLRTFDNTAFP